MTEIKTLTKAVEAKWFALIKSGTKTVEGRVCRDDWQRLYTEWKGPQLITFTCGTDSIVRVITGIVKYTSFTELLEQEGVKHVLPRCTRDEAVAVYAKIYPEVSEPVVAIHLAPVSCE